VRTLEEPSLVPPAVVRSDRGAALDRAIIAGPALLAAVVCAIGLSGRSLGFDEGASYSIASQHGAALGSAIAHDGGNMSGYYLLMHVLLGAFGSSLVVLRLPSVIATAVAVALVGVIARRLFDRRVALIAGLLSAVSLPLVYWAQTARGYALMLALALGAFVAFISLAAPDDARPPRRRAWVAYVILMTLASYATFVSVLVVPAQLLSVIRRRAALKRLGSALAAVLVLCLPLLVMAARRGSGQLFWVPRPTWEVERQVLESLTSSGLQPSFHRTSTTVILMVATLAITVVLALATARDWRLGRPVWAPATTLAWFLVPAALTFGYSLVGHPVFVPRNLLTSVPAGSIAVALVIADRRLPKALSLAVLLAVLVLRTLQVTASYSVSPEPWRQVTAKVLAASEPGDCIAFYPQDGRMAFQYYVAATPGGAARAPRPILPVAGWGAVEPYVEQYATLGSSQLSSAARGCRRLWLVSSHEGQANGPPQSRRNRALYLLFDLELERSFGAAPIAKYGYASTIHVQLLPGRQ
jgi:mannosyltransferase